MMSGIRSRNTRPEVAVRHWLHRKGYRFRLHSTNVPGHPDIVLPKYRIAIFVHGCFWHRHQGCKLAYTPKSNIDRWQAKFRENIERDASVALALDALGWNRVVVWECEVRNGSFAASLTHKLIELNAMSRDINARTAVESDDSPESV